jgi:AmmeMemoRadiSam system protein B
MTHPSSSAAQVRRPYVAGHFYPGDAAGLRRDVEACLGTAEAGSRLARGVVVPHAGYMYSGGVAGTVYGTARLPRRLILLGPNHTGLGRPVAVMRRGFWETPLGRAPIDEALADLILDAAEGAEEDEAAHRAEHSLEVQIPFLQICQEEFAFVPVCVGTGRLADLSGLGAGLAAAAEALGEPVGIVMSTDMTHYEPAEQAREKDFRVIRRLEVLDAEGMHALVRRDEISMCGYAPTTAGLIALKHLGAGRADLVAYANSGDTSGDYQQVVGYAGLLIP